MNNIVKSIRNIGFGGLAAGMVSAASVIAASPSWAADNWHQAAAVTFAVQVQSVATATTLKLPDGTTASAPISPGLIAVSTRKNVLFQAGSLAEGTGLQQLAEDGNPVPLINRVAKSRARDVEFVIPNLHYRVTASPGDRLHLAVMFVQSNDLFYAFDDEGLPLFDDQRKPISGDVTQYISLWDAGTEVNQAPGVGPDQAPRQVQPGTGEKEYEPVRLVGQVGDGFIYPPVAQVIKVTITPQPE